MTKKNPKFKHRHWAKALEHIRYGSVERSLDNLFPSKYKKPKIGYTNLIGEWRKPL